MYKRKKNFFNIRVKKILIKIKIKRPRRKIKHNWNLRTTYLLKKKIVRKIQRYQFLSKIQRMYYLINFRLFFRPLLRKQQSLLSRKYPRYPQQLKKKFEDKKIFSLLIFNNKTRLKKFKRKNFILFPTRYFNFFYLFNSKILIMQFARKLFFNQFQKQEFLSKSKYKYSVLPINEHEKSKAIKFIKLRNLFRTTGKLTKFDLQITTKSNRIVRQRYIHFRYNTRSIYKLRKNKIVLKFIFKHLLPHFILTKINTNVNFF